jgi:YtcA family
MAIERGFRRRILPPSPLKLAVPLALLALASCAKGPLAPSISVFGSYFPGWIICAVLGIVTTVVVRLALIRTGIDDYLPVPLLVYVSLALSSGIGYWFAAFGGSPT